MKAFAQHRNRFNRVLCCVLSFTLAFYMLGTPAYAAEASEASSTDTAAVQQTTDIKSTQKTDSADQQAKPSAEKDAVADKDAKADDAAKALDQQTELADELSAEPKTEAGQITAASEDGEENGEGNDNGDENGEGNDNGDENGDENGEGNNNGEDNENDENKDEYDYEITPDPEHSVSVAGAFDPETLTITYTVSIDNYGDAPLKSLMLEVFEDTADDSADMAEIPAPQGWTLDAGQKDTLTFTHSLALQPTTEAPVLVTLKVKAVAENEAYAVGECTNSCLLPVKPYSYNVDASSYVVDVESGMKRSADEYAIPGDRIYFQFVVSNNGTQPLDLSAAPVGDIVAANDVEGTASWNTPYVLNPGDTLTFVAYHVATLYDLDKEDSEADTSILAKAAITTNNGLEEHSISSAKIVKELSFKYYVAFEINSEDVALQEQVAGLEFGNMQSGAEFFWPLEYIMEHCPDGFTPLCYNEVGGNSVLVDPTSTEPIMLSEDGESNSFRVIYDQVLEQQAPYIVNYYMDSTDGQSITSVSSVGNVGDVIPVDLAGNCPTGFKPFATVTGPVFISESEDGAANTVSVVYERDSFGYTVNYYKDSVDAENLLASDRGTGIFEDLIPVNNGKYAPVGYSSTGTVAGAERISADEAANVVDVVYDSNSYTYTVNYHSKDSKGELTFIGSTLGAYMRYGSTVTLSAEQLNAKVPTGYKTLAESDAYKLVISDDPSKNTIDVVYEPDVFTYTIKYYRDSAIDDSIHRLGEAFVGEALYGSTVHVDIEMLNRNIPEIGFKAKDNVDEFDIVITEDAARNSYDVVYDRMEYGFAVAYYKDSKSPENYQGGMTGSYYYGYDKYFTIDEINQYLPAGYKKIYGTMYVTINSSNMDDNVLDIIYTEKTDNIGYTIKYYKDSISDENFITSSAGVGLYEDPIPYVQGTNAPAGYSPVGIVSGAETISLDESANVMNVVYVKDKIAYTVNYYKDDTTDENLLGTDTGSDYLGLAIPYVIGNYAPSEGYDLSNTVTSGVSTISAEPENNVLNVVYSRQSMLSWRVNYYGGSITENNFLGDVTGFGTYGDDIAYDEELYFTEGYLLPAQISGDEQVLNLDGESVLNVVYPLGTYDYTVNYYKDSISEENFLGRDTASGLFRSAIIYEQGKFAPVGYRSIGYIDGELNVGYDSEKNVLNVVYLYESYGYTVNYYVGSVSSDNLVASVSDPNDVRPYGSEVELRPSQMNMYRPDGYAEITEPVSFPITDDVATNGCNVVFAPDFGEFYTAGVTSISTTYDGTTHYVLANGVKEGDIVTFTYNGTTETRSVGIDPYIGVEFQDVTDGVIPVSISVTRAGVTSAAVQTTVNITPAVTDVPSTPQNPVTPSDPFAPGTIDMPNASDDSNTPGTNDVPAASNPDTPNLPGGDANANDPIQVDQPANDDSQFPANVAQAVGDIISGSPLGQLAERLVSYVDPGIDVPEPTTAELAMDGDQDVTGVEPIADDINPLAAAPSAPENPLSGVVSTLSLVLATLSAVASAVLMLIKLSIASRVAHMSSTAAVTIKAKGRTTTRLLIAFVSVAIVFYGLWLFLLL